MDTRNSRRELLKQIAGIGGYASLAKLGILPARSTFETGVVSPAVMQPTTSSSLIADPLLEELERGNFLFFWEQTDPETGLVRDRCNVRQPNKSDLSSIAATGFGLTALCIGEKRGYVTSAESEARVLNCLRFLWKKLPHHRGFFYHWADINTGQRVWDSEVSSVDTAILLCGILTCRQHFDRPEIHELASEIYNRVDWNWLSEDTPVLPHGWTPENGFLQYRWDDYSEMMMMYLLGLGSDLHPLPAKAWDSWKRSTFEYNGIRYIGSFAPLFIHQYSQAWFDFRGKRDRYADYFKNSIIATDVHRRFCLDMAKQFPDYSEDLWGITASDSVNGYVVWGGPPATGPIDRHGDSMRCGGIAALPTGGNHARPAHNERSLRTEGLERLRIRGCVQSVDKLVRHRCHRN